jgi:hypothetical protein
LATSSKTVLGSGLSEETTRLSRLLYEHIVLEGRMAKSTTFSVRSTPEEQARWREAAGDQKFNSWVKRALNDAADLEAALDRERSQAQDARREVAETAFPQMKKKAIKCPTPKGAFCYAHNMRH